MFSKLVGLTLMVMCLAGALLALRQHRLELAHDNAELFSQIVSTRQNLWDAQARSAALLQPQRIHSKLEQAQVAVETVDPQMPRPDATGLARRDPVQSPLHHRQFDTP
jgi:hypothetical protein